MILHGLLSRLNPSSPGVAVRILDAPAFDPETEVSRLIKYVHLAVAAALLGAAGCAAPPVAVAPLAPAAPPQAPAPASATFRVLAAEQDAAAARRLIVRWKPGKEARKTDRGRLLRPMKLARAQVLEAADATQRDALLAALRADPDVELAEPDYTYHASATADDPMLAKQWGLPAINQFEAWDLSRGDAVTVAVVDTGVDLTHPDLQGQLVKGPDLVQGDDEPADDQGHGTHCAGTVAALTNNSLGMASVAPGAKVLAIKVLSATGQGSASTIADGVLAAVQGGAKVISLSLGGPSDSSLLRAAVAQAVQAGVVVVAAAGNDGTTQRMYPAAYPDVIAVGATTSSNTRASFSNHGDWVTVAAPGASILSTRLGGGYGAMSGTSMAAPYVAGLAALIRASRPEWGVAQVREAIATTGAPVTGFEANPALRRIDAAAALRAAGGSAPTPTPAPTLAPTPAPSVAPTPTPAPSTKPGRRSGWRVKTSAAPPA